MSELKVKPRLRADELTRQRLYIKKIYSFRYGYMSIFRRFVIPTWEIRLNKLNKLKLNKLIAMSE